MASKTSTADTADPTAIREALAALADAGLQHSEYAADLRARLKELESTS